MLPMLYLYQSNRLEYLAQSLAAVQQQSPLQNLWQAQAIVVQSQGMRRYLNQFLAREHGIAANIDYSLPAGFTWQLLRQVLPGTPALNPFNPEVLRWRLLALFQSAAWMEDDFALVREQVAHYLHGSEESAYHLAGQLADVFDQYLVYRPEWVDAWQQGQLLDLGEHEAWQAQLWHHLSAGEAKQHHRVSQWQQLRQQLNRSHLPERLMVFGLATLAPIYLDLLQTIAEHIDVHVFALNPSSEHWGNILPPDRAVQNPIEDNGHPLLASLGKQGRDFFDALAALPRVQYELAIYDENPPTNTLLHRLQWDIQTLHLSKHGLDGSIQCQAAHSPLRELQILKDQLLQDLAANPSWQPHDIAVLTPHIEPYLPFIDAVFGYSQDNHQALPYSIADIKISRSHPLLQFLQSWLAWVNSRCEVDYLWPLLDSTMLRTRFEWTDADLDIIQHSMAEEGIRWGADEAMRSAFGGQNHAFSWQQGRERTVLGWFLPQTEQPRTWQGIMPWFGDLAHIPIAARAQMLIDLLLNQHAIWQQATDIDGWIARIRTLLAALADEEALAGSSMAQLEQSLSDWAAQAALASFDTPITTTVATEHIARFLDSQDQAGFLRGGITFCSMVPMRSLPFKCLCLLGLNDGDYPRTTKAPVFDLIAAHPKRGDRARRDDDRYLFLESLLSAREKLYLSYIGKDIRKNDTMAPSALLSELGDTLATMSDTPLQKWLSTQVCQHPLQPFSTQYFTGNPHLISTRQDYAQALNQTPTPAAPFYSATTEQHPAAVEHAVEKHLIDLTGLIRFWRNPVRAWLSRLGWKQHYHQAPYSSAEPFNIENEWLINQTYLNARRAHTDFALADDVLHQSNALPDGLLGEVLLQPWRQAVLMLDATLLHSPPVSDLNIVFAHHHMVLHGSLNHLYQHGQIITAAKAYKQPDYIGAYLRHLVLCAVAGSDIDTHTHILYPPNPQTWLPIPPDIARSLLGAWLDAYHLGQKQPLPFFPRTSLQAALAWHKSADPDEPNETVYYKTKSIYMGSDHNHGQQDDTEVALVFGSTEPLAIDQPLFWQLVRELLLPLMPYVSAEQEDTQS